MKKLLIPVLLFCTTAVQAQIPVSTVAQKKRVLLEEFTGMHCGYCPQGHYQAHQLLTNHPGKVDVIAVHNYNPLAGPYTPSEIDMETTMGYNLLVQAFDAYYASGLPIGTINRHKFSSINPYGIGLNPDPDWETAANTILAQDAYVNVGVAANFNPNDRKLTINVEMYYTGNTSNANNLHVFIVQDSIVGPQTDYSSGHSANPLGWVPGSNYTQYNHLHVLRDFVTGQWGEVITEAKTAGTLLTRQYTYTLPVNWPLYVDSDPQAVKSNTPIPVVVKNLKIVAFVAEGKKEVINSTTADVTSGTTTSVENMIAQNSVSIYPNPASTFATIVLNNYSNEDLSVNVVNTLGEVVYANSYGNVNGQQMLNIDLSTLSNGVYMVNVMNGGKITTERMVVAK